MATQAGGGMSATPQGVEAQQAMVDITTNNYQKAIESFFSHYCSYALTVYFQELKRGQEGRSRQRTARVKLLSAGLPTELVQEDGTIEVDFSELAVEYWVRTVPGSLVEMEDEKQLRILNELFVPLSQAMPALAAAQDQRDAAARCRPRPCSTSSVSARSNCPDRTSAKDHPGHGVDHGRCRGLWTNCDRRIAVMEENMLANTTRQRGDRCAGCD
jgi:hypothetical protein